MRTNTFAFRFLAAIFLTACGQTKTDSGAKIISVSEPVQVDSAELLKRKRIDSIFAAQQDSVEKIRLAEQEQSNKIAIKAAEKDFSKSLKAVDRDFGENNFARMRKVLTKHKKTPYNLYLELTEINKKSKEESVQKAISSGLKERKYTDFIGRIRDNYVSEFQSKYGIDNRLYLCFKNNYCSCLGDNADKYCSDRHCTLPNGDYWE